MTSITQVFEELEDGYTVPAHDQNDAMVYKDGHLASASLDSLVQQLLPTSKYCPDRAYTFSFILSSRFFLRPSTLFSEVCQSCLYQQNLVKMQKEKVWRLDQYTIHLLSEWTENFPYDFREESMMRKLKEITQKILLRSPDLHKDIGILMHNLYNRLSNLQKYEELLKRINEEVAQRLLKVMPTQTDIYEVCLSPLVLAQQLTHIELERLSMIGPEEFVQAFAKEKELKTWNDDMKKTANLESYVAWFNRLSYFVATEICMHLKKKNRVKMIEYFVDVAKECINIGNFNSLMAIIAGINIGSVQRLKKTWGKVNSEKFGILEMAMNPAHNFSSYRSCLKAALWRSQGASQDREKIVIPFFSLFVKDIYMLNEGCVSVLTNGHVNFEKFWQLAKTISEFMQWKQIECPFDRSPTVLNYLLTNPVFSEDSLSLASFECEPPESSYEKEMHKQLKSQAGL